MDIDDIDKLICYDLNNTFILHNLNCAYSSSRTLDIFPHPIVFFEYKFEIDFIIFSPIRTSGVDCISSLSIHSKSIEQWVGYTEKQEKILRSYDNNQPAFANPDMVTEFKIDLKNKDALILNYNWKMEGGYNKFHTGLTFYPSLFKAFHSPLPSEKLKDQYIKIYNLLSFFCGGDVIIDKIEIGIKSYHRHEKGSLYFSSKSTWPKHPRSYPFYPLGKDLKYQELNYPPLPLKSIYAYFELPKKEFGYFGKYIKYQRMNNVEERFLGFFRLLESLCYQKKTYLDESTLSELCGEYKSILIEKFNDRSSVTSFLKRIPKLNESKYNTEKCIQEFYKAIPQELQDSWAFKKSDIGSLCKLRNDITHANDYYIDDKEIESKTKFIEILLILSLFLKIGISTETSGKLIHRVSGYHLITNKN